jgi:nucleosome binding factor SPN SPT16 subunit
LFSFFNFFFFLYRDANGYISTNLPDPEAGDDNKPRRSPSASASAAAAAAADNDDDDDVVVVNLSGKGRDNSEDDGSDVEERKRKAAGRDLEFVVGDCTQPKFPTKGPVVTIHVVDDSGEL